MKRLNYVIPLVSILSTIVLGATLRRVELTAFNAGEMSPLMNARSDFAKTKAGARTLENMIVRTQGPVQRRPGTKYIASVKDATDTIRLVPFEYSTSDAYVIEMGDLYMRFYRNGAQILDPNNNPYEIVTPYDSNDIFEIQFAQDAEVMRLVHPDYQPYKLTRTGHAAWTLTAITFVGGPFIDENETKSSTITPSATTGNITLSATASSVWDVNHVGALWEISHLVQSQTVSGQFWTNGDSNSTSLTVFEDQMYTVTTGGDWQGKFIIQRSYDSGVTWEDVKAFAYSRNGNVLYSGQETHADALYRVRMEDQYVTSHNFRHNEGECDYTLATDPFMRHGVVRITAVVDANDANATVITTLASTSATWRWAEGAWSTYRGWPRAVEHHEQRCVYAGSASWPQTVWGSITASQDSDYDDFTEGTATEDDAWTYILPGMNPIQWLRSTEYLMIGTTAGVGRLGTEDKPINPTWPPTYRMQAKNGCAYIQAVQAVDAILYVERGAQKIRELAYTYSSDRYVAPDMTILAEHITGDGIIQIDFQNRPDPILWCVRDDGELLSFTYQRKHDVLAWSRHKTGSGDDFNSVAVIPASDEDQVWAVVGRTVDSNSMKYVEQFQPLDWGADQNDCWFVDSGKAAITGLNHLENCTVALWANGRPVASQYGTGNPFVVASGAIDPNDPNLTQYTTGLAYTSVFETMPIVTFDQEGTLTAAARARIINVQVDCYKSLGFHLGSNSSHTDNIQFSSDSFATTMDLYTGMKPSYGPMAFPYGWSRDPVIYITESDPVPLTIRGIAANMEVVFD